MKHGSGSWLLALLVAALVGVAAAAPAAREGAGELSVTVSYKGKGEVDAKHEIFVFLFDTPNFAAGSLPIATRAVTKNGDAAKFADLTVSPVYVAVAYDETGDYDGLSGPPPPGTPVAVYTTDGKGTPAPVDVSGPAQITITFTDSQRIGG